MISFQTKTSERRIVFLRLISQVERQLREAYDRRFHEKKATQSSVAKVLGVNRSAVHRRLTGRVNMQLDTIADMAWALGCTINVQIADACEVGTIRQEHSVPSGDANDPTAIAARDMAGNLTPRTMPTNTGIILMAA